MRAGRLVAPALIVMLAVTGWPLGRALYHSLFQYQFTAPDDAKFVLFDNYVALATSPSWWKAFALILGLMTVAVVCQLVLGFGFATILRSVVHLGPVVRILILVPFAVMAFGSAFAWRDAIAGGYLNTWFHLGDFSDTSGGSLLTILLSEIWRGTGIVALILFAGLQSAPTNLLESATADGAKSWQRFWRVVLPAVRPAAAIAIVYRAVDSFSMFDPVYAIVEPGSTSELWVPSTLIFDTAINRFELGLGSAMSIFLLLLSGILGNLFLKAFRIRRAV